MTATQGKPCWYELATAKGKLDEAGAFYGKVLGWEVADAGMDGFTYHLAQAGGDMTAGLMEMPDEVSGMPPFWMIYYAVDDCDAAAEKIKATGGKLHRAPADIPGTGRFAIAADPQGVAFGILQAAPMEDGSEGGNAFDQSKQGHGNWNELMSPDADAAFGFYSDLFGWQKSTPHDMGEMGTYQLFSHEGADIGGMMNQGPAPAAGWMPYFGTDGIDAAVERTTSAGGALEHGPMEVPGGAYIAVLKDPQGAFFAVTGPK